MFFSNSYLNVRKQHITQQLLQQNSLNNYWLISQYSRYLWFVNYSNISDIGCNLTHPGILLKGETVSELTGQGHEAAEQQPLHGDAENWTSDQILSHGIFYRVGAPSPVGAGRWHAALKSTNAVWATMTWEIVSATWSMSHQQISVLRATFPRTNGWSIFLCLLVLKGWRISDQWLCCGLC